MPDIIKGYKIKIPKVTGNVSIIGIASPKKSDSNVYTITNNLANCTNSNTATSVNEGSPYSATVTPNSGYELMNVAITMGGTNVTSSVYTYQNGNAVINIPNVTGNVVITVQTRLIIKIALSEISNMTVDKGKTFNILYSSNISAVKHEISWDGGSTFWDKTSEIVVSNSTNYKYTHEAKTDVSSYNMAIRVTDAKGNTSTKTFTITFRNNATDPTPSDYPITANLTHCKSSNVAKKTSAGKGYATTITADDGYTVSSITVTMGGTDVTGSSLKSGNQIYIPKVTGNIVITASATASSSSGGGNPGGSGSNPVSGNVLSYMTYGKGIDQTSTAITDNPECWATVEPVTIKKGTTYTMSVDATHLWILAIDDSGNPIVPFLTTGDNTKPQSFTFTATTSKIKFGCYDPSHTLTYCNLTESSSSGGESGGSTSYTITRNLTNCTSSNNISSVAQGAAYSTTVTPKSGYELMNVAITMGGANVTSSVYKYQDGKAVINIPSVTGNIVITVQATASSSGGETGGGSAPVSGEVLSYMTYGKGIDQSTFEMTDNPECWATVNPVTITNGKTYTISLDATYLWVLAIDDSGNGIVPFLTTGDNSNPQSFTFTATTSKIKFGCYDPNHTVTHCTLTESGGSGSNPGGGTNPGSGTSYTITRNLSYCSSSNTSSSVAAGSSYSTTITANSGYTLGSITVTMGGTNITSSAVSGNRVTISSVTGNIVISCTATSSSSGGSTPSTGSDLTGTYLFFGDSICAGGGSNGYGYPEAVKAKQPSMTAINYAVSGTCIAKNDSYDVNYPSILSRIQGSTPYADYVVLEGGFNDSWGQRNPLGTLKGGSAPTTADAIRSYSASLNAYQFTDALEKCICEIKLKYWGKKIFFVVPHTVDAAVYANTYHSRAIEVCNKWGVIVIDLRNCGMPSHQDGTYNVDGTHPSAAGYDKYFAPTIINVLKANK